MSNKRVDIICREVYDDLRWKPDNPNRPRWGLNCKVYGANGLTQADIVQLTTEAPSGRNIKTRTLGAEVGGAIGLSLHARRRG